MNFPQLSGLKRFLGWPFLAGILAALSAWLFYAAVISPTGWPGYRNKQQQVRILEKKTLEIRNTAQELFREVERLKHDPRYMEHWIRRELGWVAPNEILVQFVPLKTEHPESPSARP